MSLMHKPDPKVAASIAEDINEIDGDKPQKGKKSSFGPCDCTGGPGKDKDLSERGTGLLDDTTLCSKCNGTGVVLQ